MGESMLAVVYMHWPEFPVMKPSAAEMLHVENVVAVPVVVAMMKPPLGQGPAPGEPSCSIDNV